jgi:hypothetical protein
MVWNYLQERQNIAEIWQQNLGLWPNPMFSLACFLFSFTESPHIKPATSLLIHQSWFLGIQFWCKVSKHLFQGIWASNMLVISTTQVLRWERNMRMDSAHALFLHIHGLTVKFGWVRKIKSWKAYFSETAVKLFIRIELIKTFNLVLILPTYKCNFSIFL